MMKKCSLLKRGLALLLVLVLLVPMLCTAALADNKEAERGTDYTTVFVHGLMGWGDEEHLSDLIANWGMLAGDMPDYLDDLGYDVYVASMGPISSAWDRCCELFAQLTGTKVDYGQAHADKCCAEYADLGYCLQHARYGRDYTGDAKIDGWGPIYDEAGRVTGWYDNKINLIGHSFGGPTAMMFLQLLAEGDEDEIAWGKAQAAENGGDWHDYVSPLFWGDYDGEYLVNSVTSLAGVLNGTTFISANDDAMVLLKDLCALLANGIGVTDFAEIYDFQLEQFGLTKSSHTDLDAYFSLLKQRGFIKGSDHAFYDLSVDGTNQLKQGWKTYDNVYYFSYAGDKSYASCLTGNQLPDADMWAILLAFSAKMGSYTNKNELVYDVNGEVCGYIDKSWLANDGMVNTVSSRYPFGAKHQTYNVNTVTPGIWNVHADKSMDHFEFIGGLYFPNPPETKQLFRGMMEDIGRTVPVLNEETELGSAAQDNRLWAPTIWSSGRALLSGKPVINWAPVLGAGSYIVYRADSADGDYLKIGTTLGTIYTDYAAKSRTTYYYKVVAAPISSYLVCSKFSDAVCVKK